VVQLHLSGSENPLVGRIVDMAGNERSFSGWMELAEVLDQLRRTGTLQPSPRVVKGPATRLTPPTIASKLSP